MLQFKSLAFDLDDTLLDTTQLLIPNAVERACQAMLAAGLRCSLQECLKMRSEMAADHSHTEIFTTIARHFGANQQAKAVQDALAEFYNPQIAAQLPLMPGALENIEKLKLNYSLYLVTMGTSEGQTKKIKSLDIEKYFKKIFILNSFSGEKKETAFREILGLENHPPHQLLSIGNRLSSEIRDGKRVGARTCYFAHGEHLGEKPRFPEDHPDFTIHHHRELIQTCGL